MYTSSPAHTPEHWARKAQLIASTRECVDRIMIEDASGILTPEHTRDLISIVERNCAGIPLEFHSHCNSGLAPLCCLEAIQCGVTTVHTAVAPLANGTSLPATESVLKNARRLGFDSDLDEDALAGVSAHFREIAKKENLPIGVPHEYDLVHFEHQVPGGMMTNLTRQLRELGMEHRLSEILDEVIQVRKEFGYPVMATPYSQIVGVQAVENVVSGERYKKIPDETIKYALQLYGPPVVPVDPNVMDKIMSLPRTKEFMDWKPEGFLKSVEELRQEIGPELSDDDLLLRILIPGKAVRKPAPKKPAPATAPDASISAGSFPNEFEVEVDGEVYSVRILLPKGEGTATAEAIKASPKQVPSGSVMSEMAGLVLSLPVKAGDKVQKGDSIAVIEAMKMRRPIPAPRSGEVAQLLVNEGEIIEAGSPLMIIT
jgi:pyruvate/oxaloacetate carboxyltransferase